MDRNAIHLYNQISVLWKIIIIHDGIPIIPPIVTNPITAISRIIAAVRVKVTTTVITIPVAGAGRTTTTAMATATTTTIPAVMDAKAGLRGMTTSVISAHPPMAIEVPHTGAVVMRVATEIKGTAVQTEAALLINSTAATIAIRSTTSVCTASVVARAMTGAIRIAGC